jgi:hypothetical protein
LPLFSYLIVLGIKSSRDAWRYFTRLFVFALISQVPYFLALEETPFASFNVFFTLALGVLILIFYERRSQRITVPIVVSAMFIIYFHYNPYGLLLIGCMYVLQQHPAYGVVATLVLNTLFLPLWAVQFYSVLALPLILLHLRSRSRQRSEAAHRYTYPLWRRYFFYFYYPFHLSLLYIIRLSYS